MKGDTQNMETRDVKLFLDVSELEKLDKLKDELKFASLDDMVTSIVSFGLVHKKKHEPKERMVAGVDPGLNGAVSIHRESDGETIELHRMPKTKDVDGKDVFDVDEFIDLLVSKNIATVYVEEVQPNFRVGQGNKSSHTASVNFGKILGALRALRIPYETVKAQIWKRALGLSGKEKAASVQYVIEKEPGLSDGIELFKSTSVQHGIADAICVYWYLSGEKRKKEMRRDR